MVRKVGENGINFERVDMTAFKGEYTPMVTLDVQLRLEQAEKQEAYTNAYQIIIADPTNNLQQAKEIMYPKMMPDLTTEEIQAIITQPEQPPMEVINPEMQDAGLQDINAQDAQIIGENEDAIEQ